MNKFLKFSTIFLSLLLSTNYLIITTARAVCPVCIVAVGAGVGLTRYLGVSDLISGSWIGALILASSFWLSKWLKGKGVKLKFLTPISILLMYVMTIVPLFFSNIIGHPYNQLLGIDKLILGIIIGSVIFLLALLLDKQVRAKVGHQLFSYQKVVFPVSSLIILSLILYFLTK